MSSCTSRGTRSAALGNLSASSSQLASVAAIRLCPRNLSSPVQSVTSGFTQESLYLPDTQGVSAGSQTRSLQQASQCARPFIAPASMQIRPAAWTCPLPHRACSPGPPGWTARPQMPHSQERDPKPQVYAVVLWCQLARPTAPRAATCPRLWPSASMTNRLVCRRAAEAELPGAGQPSCTQQALPGRRISSSCRPHWRPAWPP